MRRSVLSAVIVLMICAAVLAVPGPALADTYTFTGLGGGGAPLSLAHNGTSLFAGMQDGTVWRNTEGTAWMQVGNFGDVTVNAMVYDGETVYAGTSSGEVFYYISDGQWGWAGYGAGWGNSVTCLLATGAPGSIYAGSSNRHVFRKSGVTSWQDTATDMGGAVLSLTSSSSYVYASTINGVVWRFNNNPSSPSWTNLGNCGTVDAHIAHNDALGLYALGYNHYAWRYNGSEWVNAGLVGLYPVRNFISVGSRFYAGNANGQVWVFDGSSPSNTSLPYSGTTPIQALTASGSDLYAASYNGHVGRYAGGAWSDVWPTGRAQVNALLGSGGSLWAGCENGQVYSYSGGWTPEGDNLGLPVLSLGSTSAFLYAGCNNGDVYYYNNSGA